MALNNPRRMTETNRAAHRRNGQKSRGATTPAGKERIRAANLIHGYYSAIRDEALVPLGESPAQLAELIAAAHAGVALAAAPAPPPGRPGGSAARRGHERCGLGSHPGGVWR